MKTNNSKSAERLYSDGKVRIFPNQLSSLAKLTPLLSEKKLDVLTALIQYPDEPGTLKFAATRDQIRELTGLSHRTISYYIEEFERAGLLKKSWVDPSGRSVRCFNLPVTDAVFEYYRKHQKHKKSGQRKVESTVANTVPTDSEHPVDVAKPVISGKDFQNDNGKQKSAQMTVTEEVLDPEISSLIDELEEKQVRNTTVEYLISQGVIPFQIASDDVLNIDKDELLRFLRRWKANSLTAFTRLVEEFSKKQNRPLRIDLPLSERLELWLIRALDYSHSSGMYWVWGHIKKLDAEGNKLFEEERRRDMIEFMRKYNLRTLDDVVSFAIKKDAEIEQLHILE